VIRSVSRDSNAVGVLVLYILWNNYFHDSISKFPIAQSLQYVPISEVGEVRGIILKYNPPSPKMMAVILKWLNMLTMVLSSMNDAVDRKILLSTTTK